LLPLLRLILINTLFKIKCLVKISFDKTLIYDIIVEILNKESDNGEKK